jgi:hypothetical protein
MTTPILCGHPSPNGPCTRKVLPGAGGCGFHPAPPDPPEQRQPEPVETCRCERPLVLGRRDGEPARCFLCTRALPGQPATRETASNGEEPVDHLVRAISQHSDSKLERHRDLLRAIGVLGEAKPTRG